MKRYPPVASLDAELRTRVVRDIFTTAHARYDFLNHMLSLGRDFGWRRAAVEAMRFPRTRRLLDVATGTAELAIEAAGRHPEIEVTGIDSAQPMLELGMKKVRRRGLSRRIRLDRGDALALPYPDAFFDVTAISFGLRNIPDKRRALAEMARVTVAGGQVVVLEMTFAPAPLFRGPYGMYLSLIPRVAGIFSANPSAYRYLSDSIRHFSSPEALKELMREAGLGEVTCHGLTFGSVFLHIGRVAPDTSGGM
jgi:demethylmenaquinone methyltransferase/2-methoxy-6-polyprenyl-1,4-benzoquinol methylase